MSDILNKFRQMALDRLESHRALELPSQPRAKVPFIQSLQAKGSRALILEHKRASPSHGVFEGLPSLTEVIGLYEKQSAAALSILTEEAGFKGCLDDLIIDLMISEF